MLAHSPLFELAATPFTKAKKGIEVARGLPYYLDITL